ncbi:MAG: hypothetical protein N3I35_03730 [Clostridia bacterium]|nr:hypothetical protein [Clostridia bacterium]
MKKRVLLAIILIVSIAGGILFMNFSGLFKPKNEMKIGKHFRLEVKSGETADYRTVEKIDLLDKKERESLAKYMKENGLKIKAGIYDLNQATTFKRALEILQFESIK